MGAGTRTQVLWKPSLWPATLTWKSSVFYFSFGLVRWGTSSCPLPCLSLLVQAPPSLFLLNIQLTW